jgi:hypothetical protein
MATFAPNTHGVCQCADCTKARTEANYNKVRNRALGSPGTMVPWVKSPIEITPGDARYVEFQRQLAEIDATRKYPVEMTAGDLGLVAVGLDRWEYRSLYESFAIPEWDFARGQWKYSVEMTDGDLGLPQEEWPDDDELVELSLESFHQRRWP